VALALEVDRCRSDFQTFARLAASDVLGVSSRFPVLVGMRPGKPKIAWLRLCCRLA